MAILLDREYMPARAQWRAMTFFATTADLRPQVDPALTGNEHRLRLMESLRRLLDALAFLDVAVLEPRTYRHDDTQAQRYQYRYAEADAQLQRAALATSDLLSDISRGPLFQPNTQVLRQAMLRLRRHLDDLGPVNTEADGQIA